MKAISEKPYNSIGYCAKVGSKDETTTYCGCCVHIPLKNVLQRGEYRSSKEASDYVQSLCDCATVIFGECQKAENIYNLIEKEWRESGEFNNHFQHQFEEIKNQSFVINKRMLELQKKHVQGCATLFNALLDFYNGYVAMIDCLFDTNASYDTYTRVFLSANDACLEYYQRMELLANEKR